MMNRRNSPQLPNIAGVTKRGHRLLSLSEDGGVTWGDAWEARELPGNAWWAGVPVDVMARLHFYNTPVVPTQFAQHLKLSARADDFVAIKLDIDNTPMEMEIIDVIRNMSDLVDEFYFEYHYYYDGLNFGWGTLDEVRDEHNADSALRLMSELRRAGIRAHFWF